ncbi:hypothetical protein ACFLTV_01200 [Chloroflexota bacterium]
MKVLSPEGQIIQKKSGFSPRLATLEKAAIGFLHNGKPGGEEILRQIERLLQTKYATKSSIYRRKPHAGDGAGAGLLDDYIGCCDVAIVAVGD